MISKSDANLLEEVMEELSWESLLNLSELNVKVSDGSVILEGFVDSLWKKRIAESAIKRVNGIRLLVNELAVHLSEELKKPDESIANFLGELFMWNSAVKSENILIEVKDGKVMLSGQVEWLMQKNIITELAESLSGVIQVNNEIKVVHGKMKQDVIKRIQSSFYRHAAFDLKRITVETEGNRVFLSGEVRSDAEKKDAENAAWATPGVKEVISYLTTEDEMSVV